MVGTGGASEEHLKLVLDFSRWVIGESAEDGLSIFTSEDFAEVATLPHVRLSGIALVVVAPPLFLEDEHCQRQNVLVLLSSLSR